MGESPYRGHAGNRAPRNGRGDFTTTVVVLVISLVLVVLLVRGNTSNTVRVLVLVTWRSCLIEDTLARGAPRNGSGDTRNAVLVLALVRGDMEY